MRYIIGIVTLKEVKCQILSQIRAAKLSQHAIRTALFFIAYCVFTITHVFAQTPTPESSAAEMNTAEVNASSGNTADANVSGSSVLEPVAAPPASDKNIVVEQDLEALKKTALELNRDLLILEEELLFPSNTQVVVFLSTDVGKFFTIDSVKLKINNQLVASHLYTPYENDALVRGGVQRLYIGNLKQGQHEITAVFTGEGPDKRKYKRAATLNIEKDDDSVMLELLVQDATTNMQPTFEIKEWEL